MHVTCFHCFEIKWYTLFSKLYGPISDVAYTVIICITEKMCHLPVLSGIFGSKAIEHTKPQLAQHLF